jgi:hypothetical protein
MLFEYIAVAFSIVLSLGAASLLTRGGSEWWSERRTWFTDHFQGVVDDILANPPPGFETSGHRPAPPEAE